MSLKLADDTEKRLVASIKRFFEEEMDEPIGDLKALRVLDFCLREIAPSVYNQAIADAQAYLDVQRRRPQRQQVRGGVRLLEEVTRSRHSAAEGVEVCTPARKSASAAKRHVRAPSSDRRTMRWPYRCRQRTAGG